MFHFGHVEHESLIVYFFVSVFLRLGTSVILPCTTPGDTTLLVWSKGDWAPKPLQPLTVYIDANGTVQRQDVSECDITLTPERFNLLATTLIHNEDALRCKIVYYVNNIRGRETDVYTLGVKKVGANEGSEIYTVAGVDEPSDKQDEVKLRSVFMADGQKLLLLALDVTICNCDSYVCERATSHNRETLTTQRFAAPFDGVYVMISQTCIG